MNVVPMDPPADASRHRLLVCLDLQRAHEAAAPPQRLGHCREALDHARRQDWSVVHLHQAARGDPELARPIEGLEPRPCEPVMARRGVSAFASRAFGELVEGAHRAELVVIGASLAGACLATVFAAYDRNLSTLVVEDAVWAGGVGEAAEALIWTIAAPFTRIIATAALISARPQLRLVRSNG